MADKRQLYWAGLAAMAVLATACSGDTPPAATVKVDRGAVSSTVSASGTLKSINEQVLGFADRGQLAELMVKVGDVVKAGQPLARLDAAALTQALLSAEAKRDQQQAALDKITGGNSVEAAKASLDSAQSILDATQSNVDATNSANSAATQRARVQLEFDRSVLDQARKAGCQDTSTTATADSDGAGSTTTTTATPSSSNGSGTSTNSMGAPVTTAHVRPVSNTMPMDDDDEDRSGDGGSGVGSASSCSTVQSAQRQVILSQTSLVDAQHTEDTAATQGQISVENARKTVVEAQSTLEGATRDGSSDTAAQQAALRDTQITVDGAQRDLDNATLKAPVDGTVSGINGAVGDFLAAAGGGGSLAPGSSARIPDSSAGSASSDDGTASSSGSGGGFITLTNIDTFQLVVPFEESDAAQVAPNQPVDVSIDAIAGLTAPGTVISVAPTAQTISGVVSYYATIVLNQTDPRLKDGQTAQADVRTKTVDNVLRVPSSTVRQDDGRSVVNVPGADGQAQPTTITPGLVGDDYTEVTSGLQEGQDVLVPQATVSGSPGEGDGPPGG